MRACVPVRAVRVYTSDVLLDDTASLLDGLVVLGHGGPQSLGAVVTHEGQLEVTLLVQRFSLHVEGLGDSRQNSRTCVEMWQNTNTFISALCNRSHHNVVSHERSITSITIFMLLVLVSLINSLH